MLTSNFKAIQSKRALCQIQVRTPLMIANKMKMSLNWCGSMRRSKKRGRRKQRRKKLWSFKNSKCKSSKKYWGEIRCLIKKLMNRVFTLWRGNGMRRQCLGIKQEGWMGSGKRRHLLMIQWEATSTRNSWQEPFSETLINFYTNQIVIYILHYLQTFKTASKTIPNFYFFRFIHFIIRYIHNNEFQRFTICLTTFVLVL